MIMILMVHFVGATFPLPTKVTLNNISDINTVTKTLLESFAIIGVNCFVLISGYFGIRHSAKGFINFIFTCLFYSVAIFGIYAIIKPDQYDIHTFLESFGIFSHTDLWFIPAYFALYIIAPLLNNGIKYFSQYQFTLLLIGLTFLNVYLGWFWEGKINPTGYNAMHLIYIYIIGRYIHSYTVIQSTKKRALFIIGYIISFALIVASTFVCKSTMAYAYNSPFVILTSVFFFLIFTTFTFHDYLVNYIASSAFAVYLIHKMPPVWHDLKNFLIDYSNVDSPIAFALFWISFVMMLFAGCIVIDKIRLTFTKPLVKVLSDFISKLFL
jgi:hypothetical protein